MREAKSLLDKYVEVIDDEIFEDFAFSFSEYPPEWLRPEEMAIYWKCRCFVKEKIRHLK